MKFIYESPEIELLTMVVQAPVLLVSGGSDIDDVIRDEYGNI